MAKPTKNTGAYTMSDKQGMKFVKEMRAAGARDPKPSKSRHADVESIGRLGMSRALPKAPRRSYDPL